MRILVIGGRSRLGRAIGRANPAISALVRGAPVSAEPSLVAVDDYHSATPSEFAGFAAVINCTGLVGGSADALHRANAELPLHLAQQAALAGVQHFIHVSSFSVLGTAQDISAATPVRPVSPYGQSKAAGEERLQDAAALLNISMVRLPMLYGDGPSKLARLMAVWRRFGWLPQPVPDIARAMMHYDLAASTLLHLAAQTVPAGLVAAADPEPFGYALARGAIEEAGGRVRSAYISPRLAAALMAVGGNMARGLLGSSRLAHHDNLAVQLGQPSRLRADIAEMARA